MNWATAILKMAGYQLMMKINNIKLKYNKIKIAY